MKEVTLQFGIMNPTPERDKPYGPTQYWAEFDGKRIEFTNAELDREDIPSELVENIRNQYKEN